MFRYTHELNTPVNVNTQYFPDRMLGIRARILKEKKYLPALVIGFQDPSSLFGTSDEATNYASSYLVFSKNLNFDFGNFDFTAGYSQDFFDARFKDLEGIFLGVSFTSSFYDDLSILFEHNSKGINTGFKLNLKSKFNLMLGIWDLKKPTFAFNYLF